VVAATFTSLRTILVMFLVAKDTPASMAFVAWVLMWLLARCPGSPGDYALTEGENGLGAWVL
jgi:hypothetical protein